MKKNKSQYVVIALITLLASQSVRGASGTWNGLTDGNWFDANWSASPVPGSGDTATFNASSASVNANTTVSLVSGVTVNNIIFDTSNAAAYTIGSGAVGSQTLTLNDGGSVTINPTVSNNELFNSAVILGTDGATQSTTFTNNSTTNTLTFAGGITGSTGAGVKTLNVAGAGSTTLSGVIGNGTAGTVALAVNTSGGTTTLGSANTFSGGFTLTAGTVVIKSQTSLGSASAGVALNGGVLDVQTSAATTGFNPITVGGNTEIITDRASSGTGLADVFGTLSIGASTLTITDGVNDTSGGRIQFTSGVTLTGNATFDTENNALLVLQPISGNYNVTIQSADGTGDTSIRGSSTRSSGVTTLLSGELQIATSGSALGTAGTTLQLNGGTLDLAVGGITAYNTTVGGNTIILNDSAASPATETLGTLSIGTDTLTVSNGAAATSGSANIAFGVTTLTGNATFNVVNDLHGGSTNTTLTLGVLSDGGTATTITKTGSGALTLGSPTTTLTGADQLNISAGTVNSTSGTALGAAGKPGVTVDVADGAVFNIGASQTIAALTNTTGTHTANTGSVTLGANTLTIGNTKSNLGGTFGGVISGAGAIIKAGAGAETFSGANLYSGGTTVSAGALIVGQTTSVSSGTITSGAVGTGALSLAAGTTLEDNGTAVTLANALTIAGTATFGSTGNGSLTFSPTGLNTSNTITLSSNATLTVNNRTTFNDTVSGGSNSLTVNGTGTMTLGGSNSYSGGTTVGSGSNSPTLLLTNGNNGSATGSGLLLVQSGATIGGIGTSASGSNGFNIGGKVVAGSGLASDVTGVTSLTGAATLNNSTIASATLSFNINATSGSRTSTSINVGSTGVDFTGTTSVTLTLEGSGIIPMNTPYVLISGVNSSSLGGVDGSQYTGITTDASGADGLAAGQYAITSGLSLSFTNDNGFYAPSFLFLNTVGGVDDIEVEVVPEPSTWAMMFSGLVLLIMMQRSRKLK